MIIAIDGPAASGKGTLGKRLAAHYGLRHLDTGLIYRAVARPCSMPAIGSTIASRRSRQRAPLDPAQFDEIRLKSPRRSARPPRSVSAIPEVRAALLTFQRNFGRTRPARCSTAATSER